MCGRAYWTVTDAEREMRYHNERLKRTPLFAKANYNMAPTHIVPVVLERGQGKERTIELMRWGLVPSWAKDIKEATKYSLINARGEEIETKRSYAKAFETRRCILPLSGFFEWRRPEKGSKVPYAIRLKDEPIMSVAGVWEHWDPIGGGEGLDSFSIVTTAANEQMRAIHDRMPVILDRGDEDAWLDPGNHTIAALKALLVPTSHQLELFEVSTLVNSPKNNGPEVLERM